MSEEQKPIDRLPPHSPEAEQGTLGCMLSDPNTCVPEAIRLLGSDDHVFYDLRHQTLYAHICALFNNNVPVDTITLYNRLDLFDLTAQVGGIAYLASLPDFAPSSANLGYYADIVREKFMLRRLIKTCTEAVSRVYEYEGEVQQLMDGVERDILAIRREAIQGEAVSMRQLVPDSIARIEDTINSKGKIIGIETGFPDFDYMTGGLKRGDMIVIAARPSMGKTSLAMNIAEHVSVKLGLPVGVFSMEMTKESLTDRMICSMARVSMRNLRDGFVSERDPGKITIAAAALNKAPLYIDDTSALPIMQLRARARVMVQQYGIKLFVIDYLQLATSETKRARESRQQEVTEISAGLKTLGKELSVPVIVLSQLNRELERDKNRKPRLSDLRESGAIEQDADLVGLLYKPKLDDEEAAEEAEAIPINLWIAKQRNGPRGDIAFTFLKVYTRFESAAKVSDGDVPGGMSESPRTPYSDTDPLPFSTA